MARRVRSLAIRLVAGLRLWRPADLVRRAEQALQDGEAEAARNLLREAVRLAPAWSEPCYFLSRCAAAEQDWDQEEHELLAALERDPAHRRAETALMALRSWRHEPAMHAWHLYYGGRLQEALSAFRALRIQIGGRLPADAEASVLGGIGWCFHDLGRWQDSADAFREALALEPDLAHAHKGLGIALYQMRQLPDAEAAFDTALERNPDSQDARSFLGWCAYTAGRPEEALEHFTRAREGNPFLADAWWGSAWCLWRLGDLTGARETFLRAFHTGPKHPSFDKVVEIFPRDPAFRDLLLPLAQELLRAGEAEEALGLFDKALGHAPRAEVVAGRASALLWLGRAAEADAALGLLEQSEVDSPLSSEAGLTPRLLRARAAMQLGRPEVAAALLRPALERDPAFHSARVVLAQALEASGEIAEADVLFREAASALPGNHAVRDGLARISLARRQPVFDAMDALLRQAPEDALGHLAESKVPTEDTWRRELLRGRAYAMLDRPDDALAAFRAARQLAPERADAAAEEAGILDRLGQHSAARRLRRRFRIPA